MTDQEIWWSAFLAALAGGALVGTAEDIAEQALERYLARWPDPD